MWQAYVRFIDWMMADEDPDDPWSHRSVDAEDMAAALLFLLGVWVVLVNFLYVAYLKSS